MKRVSVLLFVLLIVFSVVLTTSCTQSIRYTEEEIRNYPQGIQDNIRKGQIDLGMTPEQVRYAWGPPDVVKFLSPYEGKPREEWSYSSKGSLGVVKSNILLFYDRTLIYIK